MMEADQRCPAEEGASPETWRLGGQRSRGRVYSMWPGIEGVGGIGRKVGGLGTLSEGERFGMGGGGGQ